MRGVFNMLTDPLLPLTNIYRTEKPCDEENKCNSARIAYTIFGS